MKDSSGYNCGVTIFVFDMQIKWRSAVGVEKFRSYSIDEAQRLIPTLSDVNLLGEFYFAALVAVSSDRESGVSYGWLQVEKR